MTQGAASGVTSPDAPTTQLVEKKAKTSGKTTFLYFDGIVDGTCSAPSRLVLSADDAAESLADLTLPVAAGIDLTKLEAGTALLADGQIGADGAITLTGVESDDGAKGADDSSTAQGDFGSSKAAASRRSARNLALPRGYLRAWRRLTRIRRTIGG